MISNDAELVVLSLITITEHPEDNTTSTDINAKFTVVATTTDSRYDINYYWTIDDVIQSNSNSTTFTTSSSETGGKKVKAYAFSDINSINKGESITTRVTVASNEATWTVGPPRSIVRFEGFTPTGGYKSVDANLDDGDFTLDNTVFDSTYNIVTYYAREKNLDLTMYIDGAPGSPKAFGGVTGGEGGKSTVTLSHTQNIEHTVLGTTNNSAVFIYRGSNLLMVAGQGGQGGVNAPRTGGAAGGVNVAGESVFNSSGGTLISPGKLSLSGIFGSTVSNPTLQSGDTQAVTPNGGRTISCTKGQYWTSLGISPCSDNSTNKIKFRISGGTEVTLSDSIIRGFKAGYTLTTTEGKGFSETSGNGGRGATGGTGGPASAQSGAGGSGYTDGTANIVKTELGGVPVGENAKIKFSLVPPPPPVTTGTVTHAFNNSTNVTSVLLFDGAIIGVRVLGAGAADGQTGQTDSLKRYIVTMNGGYSNITVTVLQDFTAGGGPGRGLGPTKITYLGSNEWSIWFNKGNGFNTFARNWSVTGVQ
jgi:hypothetical protein